MNATLWGDPLITETPDPDVVDKLVDLFGYKRETVCRWSRSKMVTVLQSRIREAAIAKQRADQIAEKQDVEDGDLSKRGRVPLPLRRAAAEQLRDALKEGPDAIVLALSYSCCFLQDEEARKFATHMAGKFEEQS